MLNIIDVHTHVGKDKAGEEFSIPALKASMDRFGISHSVAFSFNDSPQGMIEQSLHILAAAKSDTRIIPFLRVDPYSCTKEQLVEMLDKGFAGLKLHPSAQKFAADDGAHFWIYEELQRRKLPVLFHCSAHDLNYSTPPRIVAVARLFPEMPVIMAHFFGGDLRTMEHISKVKNLYCEISINARTLRIRQAVESLGYDRLLFGSDAPYDSQGVALMKITDSGLSTVDQRKILWETAATLLNLSQDNE